MDKIPDNLINLILTSFETDGQKLFLIKTLIENTKDKKLLETIITQCFNLLHPENNSGSKEKSGYGGFRNYTEMWMYARLKNDPTLTPSALAYQYRKDTKSPIGIRILRPIARKAKNRLRMQIDRGTFIPEGKIKSKRLSPVTAKKPTPSSIVNFETFNILESTVKPDQIDQKACELTKGNKLYEYYWDRCFYRYREIWGKYNLYDIGYTLFHALMLYGDCPSVTINERYDREASDYATIKHFFLDLRFHVFFTIDYILDILRQENSFSSDLSIVFMLLVAFAHDIGKIYANDARFRRMDHPKISAAILRKMLTPKNMNWDDIIDNIKFHHEKPNSHRGNILKDADGFARTQEAGPNAVRSSEVLLGNWFDLDRYIDILKNDINITEGTKLRAFSHSSVAYFAPNTLIAAAQKLAIEKNALDVRLYRKSDSKTVLLRITELLKSAELIAGELKNGFFGRKYEIIYSRKDMYNTEAYFMPLIIEKFGRPSDIEKNKKGILRLIENVVPSV